MEQNNEIILFETSDKKVTLSVPMDGDTVWLSQAQMAELFDTTKQNVSLHANNCFKEGELNKKSVVKDFLTTGGASGEDWFPMSTTIDMYKNKLCLYL